jgi:hypothetical protein
LSSKEKGMRQVKMKILWQQQMIFFSFASIGTAATEQ